MPGPFILSSVMCDTLFNLSSEFFIAMIIFFISCDSIELFFRSFWLFLMVAESLLNVFLYISHMYFSICSILHPSVIRHG